MAAGIVSLLVYRSYADDLTPPEQAIAANSVGTSIAYDRNGKYLYEFVDPLGGLRNPKPLAEISPYLIAATIATEDSSFYTNPGVNFRGLARAGFENLTPFGPGFFAGSGGSSITQQLVKNVYIEQSERGNSGTDAIDRKLKETVLALELKQNYDDNQILEWYLNQIPYANFAFGAEAAAQRYFGKPAMDLTLGEAALLAGLPQAPGDYTPAIESNRPAAKARQLQVLDLMVKHLQEINAIPGIADPAQPLLTLTPEQIAAAGEEPLNYIVNRTDINAPHFVYYVQGQIEKMCSAGLFQAPGGIPCDKVVSQGGLRVITSIDLDLNAIGERVLEEEIAASEARFGGHNGSLVAIRPATGEILAYVGSRNFDNADIDGQVDIASSQQSHGSSMKMFTYLKAFEEGWVPSTLVEDTPLYLETAQGKKQINNWNSAHLGTITVRKALSESVNTAAVRTLMDVGETDMRDMAHRMGITDLRQGDCGPTVTLGACEVQLVDQTYAFSVLAGNGRMHGRPTSEDLPTGFRELDQVSVLKITDGEGRVIYEFTAPEERQVVDPAYAYMVTDVLANDAINWSRLTIDRPAAIKTGTSEDFRDGVVMGYTPDLAAGVWMGNADNTPMSPGAFSSAGTGPMWKRFMVEAHAYLQIPSHPFEKPDGIVQLSCAGRAEVFKVNTPVARNGACRGPSGQPGETASPTPKQPVFPPRTATNTPTPAAATETPARTDGATATPGQVQVYEVQEGDTLQAIATAFDVALEDLMAANGIRDPDIELQPGWLLIIPSNSGGGQGNNDD